MDIGTIIVAGGMGLVGFYFGCKAAYEAIGAKGILLLIVPLIVIGAYGASPVLGGILTGILGVGIMLYLFLPAIASIYEDSDKKTTVGRVLDTLLVLPFYIGVVCVISSIASFIYYFGGPPQF